MNLTLLKRTLSIHHSPDMITLIREKNAETIAVRRFNVIQRSADYLPWTDESSTTGRDDRMRIMDIHHGFKKTTTFIITGMLAYRVEVFIFQENRWN